jgi:hypothetical protein
MAREIIAGESVTAGVTLARANKFGKGKEEKTSVSKNIKLFK